jgi:hypothetical protein
VFRRSAGRRGGWLSLVASTAALGIALAAAASPAIGGPGPEARESAGVNPGAFDILRELNSRLDRDIKKDLDGGKLRHEVGQIDALKETMIKQYLTDYRGQDQRICGVIFSDAFFRLERIDTRLRDALIQKNLGNEKAADNAVRSARGSVWFTESMLNFCKPPLPEGAFDLIREMSNRLTRALRDEGKKLTNDVAHVEEAKHTLIQGYLGGEKVFGFALWDVFQPLELIDIDIRDAVIFDIAGDEKKSKNALKGAKSWKDLFEARLSAADRRP